MKLPRIDSLDLSGKSVLVRADLDIKNEGDLFRLEALLPTLDYLQSKNCQITLIGHRGRPEGKPNEALSLKPVSVMLEGLLKSRWGEGKVKQLKMEMMENLRFNPGEEGNDPTYAKHLAEHGEYFINDSFAASHRTHASCVALPEIFKSRGSGLVAAGFRLIQEVENLAKVRENAEKPVLVIISGIKKDKLEYIEEFKNFADKILIAGRLPEYIPEDINDPKLLVAKLIQDKEDITIHAIERFEEEIAKAATIFLTGPIGKYEEDGHRMGTERVFKAVAVSHAFKLAGGGETVTAINLLGISASFDWISVGGGACLEFLAKGTLPGIEALTA